MSGNFYRHVPNLITTGRFVLALGLFAVLCWVLPRLSEGGASPTLVETRALDAAWVLFGLAAVTDWLDGYLARRWDVVSDFGRVADPLVDKIVVCGSLVLLVPIRPSAIPAWVVVLVLSREFLVTGLRGLLERRGIPFGASIWGKTKMVVQCLAILWTLAYLAHLRELAWAQKAQDVAVAAVAIVTLASAATYLAAARRLLVEAR